jgi:hypothetical protein
MLIEARDVIYLSIQYASSLEEAFVQAKAEYMRINHISGDNNPLAGAKIGLFSMKTINEIISENKDFKKDISKKGEEGFILRKDDELVAPPTLNVNNAEPTHVVVKKEDLAMTKNELMKNIIERKDLGLLEENKVLFSENERKYIMERLQK